MKVSFKSVYVQTTLGGAAEPVDLTQIVAEAVYQNASNFEQHKLAHRIAETADGDIELSNAEVEVIKAAIRGFRFFIQKPILEALGEKFE